jgi:hypothetical protein
MLRKAPPTGRFATAVGGRTLLPRFENRFQIREISSDATPRCGGYEWLEQVEEEARCPLARKGDARSRRSGLERPPADRRAQAPREAADVEPPVRLVFRDLERDPGGEAPARTSSLRRVPLRRLPRLGHDRSPQRAFVGSAARANTSATGLPITALSSTFISPPSSADRRALPLRVRRANASDGAGSRSPWTP